MGRTTTADGTQGSRPAARTWSDSHSAVRSPPFRGAPRVPRPRPNSDSRRSLLPSGRPEPPLPFHGAAAVSSIDDDRRLRSAPAPAAPLCARREFTRPLRQVRRPRRAARAPEAMRGTAPVRASPAASRRRASEVVSFGVGGCGR